MEGYEKNRVKVTPEHVFYVIKFRKLANFGGQYLPFHCKGPHLREFRLKFDIKSFISKGQPWKILVATLEKLRQSDPRKRRFWTVFRKIFWHQVDIFGVYKCHILEIFVQPLPWQLGPFEIPHTFFWPNFQKKTEKIGQLWRPIAPLYGKSAPFLLFPMKIWCEIFHFKPSDLKSYEPSLSHIAPKWPQNGIFCQLQRQISPNVSQWEVKISPSH